MQSRTHTLALEAPKAVVFDFLSRIENLPKWATNFCLALNSEAGRHRVVTPQGEIVFRIEADRATGVIDMHGGPREEEMAYWPARVVDRLPRGSLFIFTAFQLPGMSEEVFERQCDALLEEFGNIRRFTEAA